MLVGILGHAEHRREAGAARHVEGRERRIANGGKDLAHSVGAEIQGEEAVTFLHPREIADHGRGKEFVSFASGIACFDGCGGAFGSRRNTSTFDHQAIGLLDPLPAVVAIHRKVAPDHRDDLCAVGKGGFQLGDLARG